MCLMYRLPYGHYYLTGTWGGNSGNLGGRGALRRARLGRCNLLHAVAHVQRRGRFRCRSCLGWRSRADLRSDDVSRHEPANLTTGLIAPTAYRAAQFMRSTIHRIRYAGQTGKPAKTGCCGCTMSSIVRAAYTHHSSPAFRGTVREYVVVSFRCCHARARSHQFRSSVRRQDGLYSTGAIFSPCSSLRLAGCMISKLHSPQPTRPISLTSNPQLTCSTSASGAGCGPRLCARPGEMSCYSLEVAYSRWSHCRRACTALRAPAR